MNADSPVARFRCLTGHEISGGELENTTEIVLLDRGAEVRVCRLHGAPVALSVPPADDDGSV